MLVVFAILHFVVFDHASFTILTTNFPSRNTAISPAPVFTLVSPIVLFKS